SLPVSFFATAAMVFPLLVGHGFDFFQRSEPLLHLDQPRLAQVLHVLTPRLVRQVDRGAVLHHDARHLVGDGHHLVDADATLVPGILAYVAPGGTERLPAPVQVLLAETRPAQRLFRDVLGLLARA